MKLVIFGANGLTGSALVESALAQGHEVTAFVRNPQAMTTTHPQLQVQVGDALQFDSVLKAVDGQEAVISALSARTLAPTTLLSQMSANVIHAMTQAGIQRLILTLSVGVLLEQVAPQFANIIVEHRRNAEALRASSLDWVGICPPGITDQARTGQYQVSANAAIPNRWTISRYDLADFMLAQAQSDAYLRQFVAIAN